MKDEIKKRPRPNITQGNRFSKRLEEAIKKYHNGMVDTVNLTGFSTLRADKKSK